MAEGVEDEDLAAIAWPGFVDILSSVIIMFIFFLLIVATALYFHILIYKSQILASENTHQQKVVSEEEVVVSQMQTEFAESKEQKVTISSDSDEMIVFFGRDSISVLPETIDELKAKFAELLQDGGEDGYTIKILAAKNPNTYENAARKVAVARMLNIRNVVLESGFSSPAIMPQVVESEKIDDTIHWVKIVFEKK